MGGCLSSESGAVQSSSATVGQTAAALEPDSAASRSAVRNGPDVSTSAPSSVDRLRKPSMDGPEDHTARSSGDSGRHITGDGIVSPKGFGPNPNPLLTESALQQLNQAPGSRRGLPSSTGGTTANTRPTEGPELPELADVPEAEEIPDALESAPPGVGSSVSAGEAPHCTPPPLPEGLPVVSLQDIAVMEQKRGYRGRQIKSRRGSTTASHASLSAIPENVEITPLHARSERSDSVRVAHPPHGISKLADVQELDVESKSNTGVASRPSQLESSPSSSSVLTAGDDSVMPAHVEVEYELHMPVLPQPRAYWRIPNATEYAKTHPSGALAAMSPASAPAPSPLRVTSADGRMGLAAISTALSDASLLPSGGGGSEDRVLTDASGLELVQSTVKYGDAAPCVLEQAELRLVLPEEYEEGGEHHEVAQGTVQEETIVFHVPQPVEGLRCVKKYSVGELSWDQTVLMGDYQAGRHAFQFEASRVPTGTLTLGKYRMKTVFMDVHGNYLWAGVNDFHVVRAPRRSLTQ